MTTGPIWLDKVCQYFNDGFLLHEDDYKASLRANKFIRWWLEQIRNLLIVSAFYFLAQKSDSLLLKTLANITYFVFFGYFASWLNNFSFRFLPYIKNPKANFWANLVLWMLIAFPIFMLSVVAVGAAFDALSKIPPK
jgi:hypothetical protein